MWAYFIYIFVLCKQLDFRQKFAFQKKSFLLSISVCVPCSRMSSRKNAINKLPLFYISKNHKSKPDTPLKFPFNHSNLISILSTAKCFFYLFYFWNPINQTILYQLALDFRIKRITKQERQQMAHFLILRHNFASPTYLYEITKYSHFSYTNPMSGTIYNE